MAWGPHPSSKAQHRLTSRDTPLAQHTPSWLALGREDLAGGSAGPQGARVPADVTHLLPSEEAAGRGRAGPDEAVATCDLTVNPAGAPGPLPPVGELRRPLLRLPWGVPAPLPAVSLAAWVGGGRRSQASPTTLGVLGSWPGAGAEWGAGSVVSDTGNGRPPNAVMEVGFWSDTLLGSPLPAGGPGPAPGVCCLPTSQLPPPRDHPGLSPPTGPLHRPLDLEGPAPPSPRPRASSTPSTRPGPQEVFDNRGSRTARGLLDVHRAGRALPGVTRP